MQATKKPSRAIRLSITKEVDSALKLAKKRYPALSDPEILKLGLSRIVTNKDDREELREVQRIAAHSVGYDYLDDHKEDVYTLDMGEKVDFS